MISGIVVSVAPGVIVVCRLVLNHAAVGVVAGLGALVSGGVAIATLMISGLVVDGPIAMLVIGTAPQVIGTTPVVVTSPIALLVIGASLAIANIHVGSVTTSLNDGLIGLL